MFSGRIARSFQFALILSFLAMVVLPDAIVIGFMDYGMDWSEITSEKSFGELLQASVFYAGVGLTTGAGAGVSLGILRYSISDVQVMDIPRFKSARLF